MCFDGPARDGHVAEQIDGSFKAKPLTTKVKLDVEMTMATPAWGQAFSSDTSKMSAQEAANAQAMGLGYRFEHHFRAQGMLEIDGRRRSEERRVGKECVVRVDLGGRRNIKKKTIRKTIIQNIQNK